MDNKNYLKKVQAGGKDFFIYDISKLETEGFADISNLPYSIRILVENLLRNLDGDMVREEDLRNISNWKPDLNQKVEIPHHPGRVLMQDFTGVPAVVDLASMRDAIKLKGGNPSVINPVVPVDLVIDHSVQVDYFGTADALDLNVKLEYERNNERYKLLKWAFNSFDNFNVVPPNSGICHQVNLEFLSRCVDTRDINNIPVAFPDSLVGTDSHTTMVNGIGVMAWGVGGIEAEAVMLGRPYYMTIPKVCGVKFTGKTDSMVTATDIVLTVTQKLRELGVVEKFVEFYGPGLKNLTVQDRATIANMAPEYGATMGFFPIDEKTVDYFRDTGRSDRAEIIDACAREMRLFADEKDAPSYSDHLEIKLDDIVPSVAGHKRPQDRINLDDIKPAFNTILNDQFQRESGKQIQGKLKDGSIVIAAITSCTNTSNPYVLTGAGLLAENAVKKGLTVPDYVKTSFAPGSRAVTHYLKDSGLLKSYEALKFNVAGYGCTTCIGNSGPLHPDLEKEINESNLAVAAVLSGNRNFEARIHQLVKCNFLASPMLVIAFALAGHVDIDFKKDALGEDHDGNPVYLADIWPEQSTIEHYVKTYVLNETFSKTYKNIYSGDAFWSGLSSQDDLVYLWDDASTYIKNPPFFQGFSQDAPVPGDIVSARALLMLGDSVTTDHISPAGAIPADYPAGQYLIDKKTQVRHFNTYGSRRGNDEVMTRGTFANIRIKNKLAGGLEGGFTKKLPEGDIMSVYDAASEYRKENIPLIVIGGKEYGTGSSRDWAAKGTQILGVRAVITESFERIHRSNLVGMGVLPLVFKQGESSESLGLTGEETFTIRGVDSLTPGCELGVTAEKDDGSVISFQVITRLDSLVDIEYYKHGGILPYVLREFME